MFDSPSVPKVCSPPAPKKKKIAEEAKVSDNDEEFDNDESTEQADDLDNSDDNFKVKRCKSNRPKKEKTPAKEAKCPKKPAVEKAKSDGKKSHQSKTKTTSTSAEKPQNERKTITAQKKQLKELQQQIDSLQEDNDLIKARERKLVQDKDGLTLEVKSLKDKLKSELANLKKTHNADDTVAKNNHKAAMAALTNSHKLDLENLSAKHTSAMSTLQDAHKLTLDRHGDELKVQSSLLELKDVELNRQDASAKEQRGALEALFNERLQVAQSEAQTFKVAAENVRKLLEDLQKSHTESMIAWQEQNGNLSNQLKLLQSQLDTLCKIVPG